MPVTDRSAPTLTVDAARAHYDALGQGQDREMRYAAPAFARLIDNLDFTGVAQVVELGPGTGSFAEMLLGRHLSDDAAWLGLDVSTTMRDAAARRLSGFGDRAVLRDCAGDGGLALPDRSADLVVSTYVLDLLSADAIDRFLVESARVLRPGGQLAIAGLAPAAFSLAGINMALWTVAHRLAPRRVGGCRPVRIDSRLPDSLWQVTHRSTVRAAGIQSATLVARRAARASSCA